MIRTTPVGDSAWPPTSSCALAFHEEWHHNTDHLLRLAFKAHPRPRRPLGRSRSLLATDDFGFTVGLTRGVWDFSLALKPSK